MSGQQPTKPATITATLKQPLPAADNLWLITQHAPGDPVELQPAKYNPATRTLTATMPHFSLAFFARIDIGAALNEITKAFKATFGLAKERPGCAGKALVVGPVRYTLPQRYLSKGDGIVWPCLRKDGQKVALDLTAASGLPYLVRVNPKAALTYGGIADIGKAAVLSGYWQLIKNPPYTQALLVPGASINYAFNGNQLPGIAVAKLDLGTHLALSAVWAVQFILEIFGKKIELLKKAEVLTCITDVVEAATPPNKPLSGAKVGEVLKAAISCAGSVIRAAGRIVTAVVGTVVSALAGGVGLAIAGFEGAIKTATGGDLANIQIGRHVDASLADSPFVGDWFVHGGTLTIRPNGTATISYRYGSCDSAPTEDCYLEQTLSVQLAPDGAIATTTVRSVRYLALLDGSTRVITRPDPDIVNTSEQPGTVQRFRLIASNVIKNIDRSEDAGNPHFCRTDDPPPSNGPCGA